MPTAGTGAPTDRPPLAVPAGPGVARSARVWLTAAIPYVPALVPAVILLAIVLTLVQATSFVNFGAEYFGLKWNPPQNQWGIGVFVIGSLLTSVPALAFSMLIGLGLAIASTTYLPKLVGRLLDPFVDLLAGIPSVVYGIWAFIVIAPIFGTSIEPWMLGHLGHVPGLGPPIEPEGIGIMISVFVLTLMALPITTLLIRDAFRSVPRDLWESGLALGATRWEVVRRVVIPYSRRSIWSAAFLGFGRAFGETVAVAMVIGSATTLPTNLYSISNTMAATMFELLDSAFGGTGNANFLPALAEMALVLLAISLAVNLLGRRLISSLYAEPVPGL